MRSCPRGFVFDRLFLNSWSDLLRSPAFHKSAKITRDEKEILEEVTTKFGAETPADIQTVKDAMQKEVAAAKAKVQSLKTKVEEIDIQTLCASKRFDSVRVKEHLVGHLVSIACCFCEDFLRHKSWQTDTNPDWHCAL